MTKYYKVTAENGTVFGRSVSNPDKKVVCATSIIDDTVEPTRKYDLRYEPVEITAKEYREILKNLKKLNVRAIWTEYSEDKVGFKNGYEGAVYNGREMLVEEIGSA